MNVDEIKKAVDDGETIHWASTAYRVIKPFDSYLIMCDINDNCIGLTHKDGVTLNGREEQFFKA